MSKIRLIITESRCRCGYVKSGDSFAWQAKAITIIAVSMLSTVAAIAEGATILNSKE